MSLFEGQLADLSAMNARATALLTEAEAMADSPSDARRLTATVSIADLLHTMCGDDISSYQAEQLREVIGVYGEAEGRPVQKGATHRQSARPGVLSSPLTYTLSRTPYSYIILRPENGPGDEKSPELVAEMRKYHMPAQLLGAYANYVGNVLIHAEYTDEDGQPETTTHFLLSLIRPTHLAGQDQLKVVVPHPGFQFTD